MVLGRATIIFNGKEIVYEKGADGVIELNYDIRDRNLGITYEGMDCGIFYVGDLEMKLETDQLVHPYKYNNGPALSPTEQKAFEQQSVEIKEGEIV